MTDRELLGLMTASLAASGIEIDGALRTAHTILEELDKQLPAEPEEEPEPPGAPGGNGRGTGPVMPFGKWKGLPLDWVAKEHPDYLEWALENMQRLREPLRNQIRNALRQHGAHTP